VIFSEYYGENHVILLQTVAEWRCFKLCAVVSGPFCMLQTQSTTGPKEDLRRRKADSDSMKTQLQHRNRGKTHRARGRHQYSPVDDRYSGLFIKYLLSW